jgi:hypothetical protein
MRNNRAEGMEQRIFVSTEAGKGPDLVAVRGGAGLRSKYQNWESGGVEQRVIVPKELGMIERRG